MLRIFCLMSLWWCLVGGLQAASTVTTTLSSNTSPSVDLDHWQTVDVLSSSQYLLAEHQALSFDNVDKLGNWQALGRDQLRFGLITQTVWLDMPFHTTGTQSKPAILAFHRLIDYVDIRIFQDGQLLSEQQRGAYVRLPEGFITTNKNILSILLEPGHEYRLLAKVRGNNAITGSVQLWEQQAFQRNDQLTLYFFITYAVAVFAIALHNVNGFLSTQSKVFLYHVMYAMSLLVFQAGQYGYMDYLFNVETTFYKEMLLIVCFCIAYISALSFIINFIDHSQEPFFEKATYLLIGLNGLLIILSPFIGFHLTLLLFASGVLMGVVLGAAHVVLLYLHHDSRGKDLLFMMFLFAPSSSLLLLSRFGFIDDSFLSEHLILLVIVGEMFFMSILMFREFRQMRKLSWQSQFFDPQNKLPNILALKQQLAMVSEHHLAHALNYCWISGMEKMEIARGTDFRGQYLQQVAQWLNNQLKQEGFALNIPLSSKDVAFDEVFYCDKNTFGFITHPLNTSEHERLQHILLQAIELMRMEYSYSLEIVPILASTNANQARMSIAELMQNTTVALSQCLQNNNALLLYNDDVGYNERRRITLLHDFEKALFNNQFYLNWQPQLDSRNQRLSGLEALVRWKHPIYGEVSPAQFIPLLEQNAQITPLSLWVLQQVFNLTPRFLVQYPDIDISINLSVYDLMGDALLPAIDGLLKQASPSLTQHLIIEVTESMHMEDNQRVLNAVESLQARGFRISIDDFGAGYASFGYLQTLPVNELKIDRRYTETCHEPNSQAIIRSIIELAKSLNMTIVVEGIENQRQQELFTYWGVHRLQGWKLGKPVTQHEILASFH